MANLNAREQAEACLTLDDDITTLSDEAMNTASARVGWGLLAIAAAIEEQAQATRQLADEVRRAALDDSPLS